MRAYGLTSPGLVRSNNEDAFLCDDQRRLFVVADGMGGHAAGEVASRLAIDTIGRYFGSDGVPADADATVPIEHASPDTETLRLAVARANDTVFEAASRESTYSGMGTTVVAARLAPSEDRAVIAHVGDSRLYVFADGELTLLTRDDSWMELTWATQGAVAAPPGAAPPGRNVLTNVLGVGPQVTVHVAERDLPRPGVLLLCSDGLHAYVPHGVLEQIMTSQPSLEAAVGALIEAALARGGPDNVTALAVAYGEAAAG